MHTEKREHQRFTTTELNAIITILPPPPDEVISLQGMVLDLSQKGIKIKLDSPMPHDIPNSQILINITMPQSGLPINIKGSIRHVNKRSEFGIYYDEAFTDDELDSLLFECVKV
jgi:hypothetical protein